MKRSSFFLLVVPMTVIAIGAVSPLCSIAGSSQTDIDKDGIKDGDDNCPFQENADQKNSDNDQDGDVCDDYIVITNVAPSYSSYYYYGNEPLAMSGDGRYITFKASAKPDNALSLGTSGIFVHDRKSGKTEVVSVSSNDEKANDHAEKPSISCNGRYVVFESKASNLVPGDENGLKDIFVRDRKALTTKRISNAKNFPGATDASISCDGRYIVFEYETPFVGIYGVPTTILLLYDQETGLTKGVRGIYNGKKIITGHTPSISGDGRYVVFFSTEFYSYEKDGKTYSGSSKVADSLIFDRENGKIEGITFPEEADIKEKGGWRPVISGNGRHIMLSSNEAYDLMWTGGKTPKPLDDIFIYHHPIKKLEIVSVSSDGQKGNDWSGNASVSGDGRYIAFGSKADNLVLQDNNEYHDAFVHDGKSGVTQRVSVSTEGEEQNNPGSGFLLESPPASISYDGRYVAFQAYLPLVTGGEAMGGLFVRGPLNDSQGMTTSIISIPPE